MGKGASLQRGGKTAKTDESPKQKGSFQNRLMGGLETYANRSKKDKTIPLGIWKNRIRDRIADTQGGRGVAEIFKGREPQPLKAK